MNISIAGNGTMNEQEFTKRWKGGAYAGSETEEFKKRFPVRVKNGPGFTGWVNTPVLVDFVADLNLRLHIQPSNRIRRRKPGFFCAKTPYNYIIYTILY